MIQISGINSELVTPVKKPEPLRLDSIDPNIRTDKTEIFRSFPEKEKENFTKEEVEQAVKSTNRLLNDEHRTQYQFEVHEGTGRVMVNLVDKVTKEVIREIPPEKILDLVANIWERLGILVDERG